MSTWLNWKLSNQHASYALLLILPFCVSPLCACTHLVRDLFLMLHCLSVRVRSSHLSNHLWNFTSLSYPIDSACVCVHACAYACISPSCELLNCNQMLCFWLWVWLRLFCFWFVTCECEFRPGNRTKQNLEEIWRRRKGEVGGFVQVT